MSSSNPVAALLDWCAHNDVWIDPRLEVRFDEISGISVYAKDFEILPETSLVRIHRDSVLSVRSSSISGLMDPLVLGGSFAQLSLSVALYAEYLKGEGSRWFGYLQSLPKVQLPLPSFWKYASQDDHSLSDGREGLMWLQGTGVERYQARNREITLEKINNYYVHVAKPLLDRYSNVHGLCSTQEITLAGFHHAYTLVSSRAFLVDAYHGLSMVPIADAFNHSNDNHVHLEAEFDVCTQCGSLYECPHDVDELSHPRFEHLKAGQPEAMLALQSHNKFDSYYEMMSNTLIIPNEEVFNTYGESISNAELLVYYGFVLDANENDHIHWDFEEVLESCHHNNGLRRLRPPDWQLLWVNILQGMTEGRMQERILGSDLVFLDPNADNDCLCIDCDGRISFQMWLLVALPICLGHMAEEDCSDASFVARAHLDTILEFQLALEGAGRKSRATAIHSSAQQVELFSGLTQSLISVCHVRKSLLGKGIQDTGTLNELLDALPHDMVRTRSGMLIAMSELSILDSCISAWEDINSSIASISP